MIAILAFVLKVLPFITGLLTLIGGINGVNATQTVVTYGASPSSASIMATVIPLLLAGLSKLATTIGKQKLDALLQHGARSIGLSDQAARFVVDAVDVGRIAVYAKLHSEAVTEDERAKIRQSADVAIEELRNKLFPVKAGAA